MNPVLVIGATGTIGRQVVCRLDVMGAQVRAMARNPGAARLPPQVEVVRGDLAVPETLDGCLDGVDTVFLVWTAPPAAVAAGFGADREAGTARSYFSQRRSKRHTRSSNSPIRSERCSSKSSG